MAAKGSVDASASLWLAGVMALAVSAACLPRSDTPYLTPIGMAILAHAAWLVLTNTWINSYTSAATYDAAFLVAGFLVGRRAGRENAGLLLTVALVFAASLAGWSLWQRLASGVARGHALFETPATLATVINFVLLPGLVVVASGRRNGLLLITLALLAAALIGSASRGGWIACIAALAFAGVLFRRAAMPIDRRIVLSVAAIFTVGAITALLAFPLTWHDAVASAQVSGMSRLALYRTATDAITGPSWLVGTGYLSFRYVLEAARATTFGYESGMTYFVHDDYLQQLLELGVPGVGLLLLVAALPLVQIWRALPRLDANARVPAIAVASAMASMAVHGLVDFPFHIALCLAMYGTAAGVTSVLVSRPAPVEELERWRIPRAAIAGFALWMLAMPVAAEMAAARAQNAFAASEAERAAYWFETARRLERRDWRYHWYAGQFWYVQAQASASPKAARLADESLRAGFAANPRDVSSLLWLIGTHIHLRALLTAPADMATLDAWGLVALGLAPLDPRVQQQRELIARFEAEKPRQ